MVQTQSYLKGAAMHSLYMLGAPAVLRGRRRPVNTMIVLAYHSVTDDPSYALPGIRVTPRLFADQVAYLKRCYQIVDLAEALDARQQGHTLPERAVAITFDDGYRDNHDHAFPILQQAKATATIFATVEPVLDGARFWVAWLYEALYQKIDQGLIKKVFGVSASADIESAFNAISARLNFCSAEERDRLLDAYAARIGTTPASGRMLTPEALRDLQKHGIRIGSHTLSHPILANLDPGERWMELIESRIRLETALDRPVGLIAYPNGRSVPRNFNADVVRDCAAAGYQGAATSVRGPVTPATDPFALPRMGISQSGGLARFAMTIERLRAQAGSLSDAKMVDASARA